MTQRFPKYYFLTTHFWSACLHVEKKGVYNVNFDVLKTMFTDLAAVDKPYVKTTFLFITYYLSYGSSPSNHVNLKSVDLPAVIYHY